MSSSPTPLARASQITLFTSLIAYPLLFHTVTPSNPTAARFSLSREAISAAHCTLVTALSLYELHRTSPIWNSAPTTPAAPTGLSPLISMRSAFANSITALETGYLLQDAVILILGARLRARAKGAEGRLVKELNWRVLGWHHVGFSTALGALQWWVAGGREKGILVVVMLLLMNASTLVGTLHWYLVNFCPAKKCMIMWTNVSYLVVYAVCRVYLVYYVVKMFGAQTGQSALEAFLKLRSSCQIGTAAIGAANTIWLLMGLRKFARRYLTRSGPRKNV